MANRFNKLSASDLMQYLKTTNNFESVLKKVKITSINDGNCTAEMTIEEEHSNPLGTLHGGLSATLVDSISSFALFSHNNGNAASVSVDIHMKYMKAAKIGDTIEINANTLRAGKTLGFLEVLIKDKISGDTLVKGSQTKYFLR